MKIEIVISRKGVMGITEGISVTIAQHNGGTPSFEQLWASDSESPKLDIYYREGISDLERRLEKWLQESSAQFDLQATGEDYKLKLNVSRSWPTRLEGLLKNKVQDYLVHTVTAGWLNDFEGISVKQDYQAMAAQDLDDIVYIVGLKSFGFAEKERSEEADKDEESDGSAQDRRTDEDTPTAIRVKRPSLATQRKGKAIPIRTITHTLLRQEKEAKTPTAKPPLKSNGIRNGRRTKIKPKTRLPLKQGKGRPMKRTRPPSLSNGKQNGRKTAKRRIILLTLRPTKGQPMKA